MPGPLVDPEGFGGLVEDVVEHLLPAIAVVGIDGGPRIQFRDADDVVPEVVPEEVVPARKGGAGIERPAVSYNFV